MASLGDELEGVARRLVSPCPPCELPQLLHQVDALLIKLREALSGDGAEDCLAAAVGAAGVLGRLARPHGRSDITERDRALGPAAVLSWQVAAAAALVEALLHGLERAGMCERLGTKAAFQLAASSALIFEPRGANTVVFLLGTSCSRLSPISQRAAGQLMAAVLEVMLAAAVAAVSFAAQLPAGSRLAAVLHATALKPAAVCEFFKRAVDACCWVDGVAGARLGRRLVGPLVALVNHMHERPACLPHVPPEQLGRLDEVVAVHLVSLSLKLPGHGGVHPCPLLLKRWWSAVQLLGSRVSRLDFSSRAAASTLPALCATLLCLLRQQQQQPFLEAYQCQLRLCQVGRLAAHMLLARRVARQPLSIASLPSAVEAATLCMAGSIRLLGLWPVEGGPVAEGKWRALVVDTLAAALMLADIVSEAAWAWNDGRGEQPAAEQALQLAVAVAESSDAAARLVGALLTHPQRLLEGEQALYEAPLRLMQLGTALLDLYSELQAVPAASEGLLRATRNATASAAKLALQLSSRPARCVGVDKPRLAALLAQAACMAVAAGRGGGTQASAAQHSRVLAVERLGRGKSRSLDSHYDMVLMTALHASKAMAAAITADGDLAGDVGAITCLLQLPTVLRATDRSGRLLYLLGGGELLAELLTALLASDTPCSPGLDALDAAFEGTRAIAGCYPREAVTLFTSGLMGDLVSWVVRRLQGSAGGAGVKAVPVSSCQRLLLAACRTIFSVMRPMDTDVMAAWEEQWLRFQRLQGKALWSVVAWEEFQQQLLPPVVQLARVVAAMSDSKIAAEKEGLRGCLTRALQLRQCAHLGCTELRGVSEGRLAGRRCGGCGLVRYCSRACQLAAWPEHASLCKASGS